jgi:uncharacterized protein involved in exopolysaccharide biosynthesis
MARQAGGAGSANNAAATTGPAVEWDDREAVARRAEQARAEMDAARRRVEKLEAHLEVARESLAEAEDAVDAAEAEAENTEGNGE